MADDTAAAPAASPDRLVAITLGQWTITFVPAAGLLIAALAVPELTRELDLNRTRWTIWAATLLLLPSLALYPFRSAAPAVANLTFLYWIFAWVVFLVHARWAVFVVFDGVADTFRQQGTLIAGVNFLLTALWTADVALLWVRTPHPWLLWSRLGVRAFAFLVFAVTLLFLRQGAVWWLGLAFAAAVIGALVVRWIAAERTERVEAAQPSPA